MTSRHHLSRRSFASLLLAGAATSSVFAQGGSYPERPVRLIVPFAPGAGTDAMGRLVAQKFGEILGGTFVVENRVGASGAIGTQHVAQSAPDGYTLLLVASPFTTVPAAIPTAGYDPVRSFTPVGMIATGPLVWAANTTLPANNMRELVALAKQKPGVLNYGSAGSGGVNHLVLEQLKARSGTFITHIPYRGVAPATMDMIAGQIQVVTGTIPALLPFIKDGRVKPLAVTSARRSPVLPEVQSMGEAGFQNFDVLNYFGIVAPAGTPPAIVDKLNQAIAKMVTLPEVTARFRTDAVDAAVGAPAALGQFIESDFRAWRDVVVAQKLRIDD